MMTAAALDPAAGLILQLGTALLLLSASLHKLRDLSGFERALAGYELLPRAAVAAHARVFAGLELVLALGCLLPATRALAVLAAAALLSLYTGALALRLARGGRGADCGCGGPGGPQPIGTGLVVRNLAVIALLLLSALPRSARALHWLDAVTVAAGVLLLALLYAGVDVALANRSRARREGGLLWSRR